MKLLAWLLVVVMLALAGVAHALPHGGAAITGVGVPTISSVSPTASTTATGIAQNGQTIVSLAVDNPATSFAIASCSGCANYFAIDNSGNITVTATGVSNITAALLGTTYTPVANATNASGTGPNQNIAITFYPDGALSAASGATAQVPTQFNGYATRPPWKVPGVDYGVGPSSGCPTTDWQSISQSGVAVNTGASPPNVTVSQSGVTLDCVDFSLHNGAVVNFAAATNGAVTNSVFGGTNLKNTATCVINADTASGGLTAKWNTIDGSGAPIALTGSISGTTLTVTALGSTPSVGMLLTSTVTPLTANTAISNIGTCGAGAPCSMTVNISQTVSSEAMSAASIQTCLILSTAPGTMTVWFNWLKNAAQQFVDFNNTSGTATLDDQFNLRQNGALATNDHMNYTQWNGGTLAPKIQFNLTIQTTAPATNAGEGFQLYNNAGSATISSPKTNNNVMIAKQASAANTMTFLIHGWVASGGTQSGTWQSQNNYFDISGAAALYYPGSCTGSISFSGGFNMVTGAGAPTSC